MNKYIKTALTIVPLLTMLMSVNSVWGEDTDIYGANTDALTNPNILIMIDNSANWSRNDQGWPSTASCAPPCKQGQAELTALRLVTSELASNVNVGLMLFSTGAIDGAYVRWDLRPMDPTNQLAFQKLINNNNCVDGINTVNLTPNCIYKNFSSGTLNESISAASINYSTALFEVFKYFGGYTSPLHALDDIAGSPVDASHFGTMRYSTLDTRFDRAAYNATPNFLNYTTPLVDSCSKNYLVVIGNGFPNQDSPASLLTGVGGDATPLPAPDFDTKTFDVQTQLGAAQPFANMADCVAAANAKYGTNYTTYDCIDTGGTSSATDTFTSACNQYPSAAAIVADAATVLPGYSSYSVTNTTSCVGTLNLGNAVCGTYATKAACEADLLTKYPGYTNHLCTASSFCAATSATVPNFAAAGVYADAATCEAAAALKYPGYTTYTCNATAINNNVALGTSACYLDAASCAAGSSGAYPNYSAVTCNAATASTCDVGTTTCAAASAYNTASKCDLAAPGILGSVFSSYSCISGANCATGKTWTIVGNSGGMNHYAVTGTSTAWSVTGTKAAGTSFNMFADSAGGSSFSLTGTKTDPVFMTYGNVLVTSAIPRGTFSTTSTSNADEWASFLYKTDLNALPGQQNISTYTIDVFKDKQDMEQTKVLMNMARVGGGKYFTASDENSIRDALRKIFAEIQSVNSVFASSSLPVSVNTQGTYLNQVFMGMFRPKGNATPRWSGNLKQYQFAKFAGILKLADKNGAEAISVSTGFIDPCADSYWSLDTGSYWNYSASNARGVCSAKASAYSPNSFFSDSPDGDIVEKGGAALRLRGSGLGGTVSTNYLTRNVKTCDNTSVLSCTALTNFNNANATLTSAAFGIPVTIPTPYKTSFVDWVRGKDADDERVDNNVNEVRPSVHGGVVHSQPAVIDYGGTTGVIVYYGSDDGMFHAVDGGQTAAEGNELWSFIAPEHYQQLHRVRDNGQRTPLIDFPGITGSVAPKEYGFDGGTGVLQKGSTVWIYPSMRRGGRAIYAFDVSNPSSPVLKWRRGCYTSSTSNDTVCNSGWQVLGQTWSKPTVAYLRGSTNPVLIMGAGYDTCEDVNSQTRCTTTPRKGSLIVFLDATTSAPIRLYNTNYSVPGDLTLVKDAEGFVTQVYGADTGGYIYRINVGSRSAAGALTGPWTLGTTPAATTIAYMSEAGHARKFLSGPTVVPYAGFNAVLIGSGDREHPLMTDYACNNGSGGVKNQYYMLVDKPLAYPALPIVPADLVDVTTGTGTFDPATTTFTSSLGLSSTKGWKFDFSPCEQSVNKGLVIGGVAYFGTNTPATVTTACETDLGEARGYAIDFLTGNPQPNAPRSAIYTGGGMPPSPVAGVVDLGGEKQPFCIGCIDTKAAKSSALQGVPITIKPESSRFRSYWYMEND